MTQMGQKFGGNAPPIGARISRQEYIVKTMLGEVIVRIRKYNTNVIVRNDEIRCYCMEGLKGVILPDSVGLE
jgi:hypothetical protein